MRSPSSCPPFIPHAEKKPELPPSGAWRPRSTSRGVMTDAPCRVGRAVHRASVVTAQPRGGPSGGAVCPLLPSPPNARLGGLQAEGPRDPRRQRLRLCTAASAGSGVCPRRSGPTRTPPGTSLLGADAWGASGAPSWRGARGELRWGSPTLSLQLPSCPSLVTLPSPCRGVGWGEAGQPGQHRGRGRAARSPVSRLVNVPASWCGPLTCSPTWRDSGGRGHRAMEDLR